MLNRTPIAAEDRGPIPEFAPVPVRYRHDGWTPERQKLFIQVLYETGIVTRAAAAVNMSLEGAYDLRARPDAADFRAAWAGALNFGVLRLKDTAFERAQKGEMIPVFHGGKLMGFRRKFDNQLLMFCLRQYGEDGRSKHTVINYVSSQASASAGGAATAAVTSGGAGAIAGASATSVRTVITARGSGIEGAVDAEVAVQTLDAFTGVALDAEAEGEIRAALERAAERRRAIEDAVEESGRAGVAAQIVDETADWVTLPDGVDPCQGTLEAWSDAQPLSEGPFHDRECYWTSAGEEVAEDWLPYISPDKLVADGEMPAIVGSELRSVKEARAAEKRVKAKVAKAARTAAALEHHPDTAPRVDPAKVALAQPRKRYGKKGG